MTVNLWIRTFGLSVIVLLVFSSRLVSSEDIFTEEPVIHCRVSGGSFLTPEHFSRYSCAKCYRHMDNRIFANGTKLRQRGLWLQNPVTNELYEATYENKSSPIFKTFRTSKEATLWIKCCKAAVKCCKTMRRTPLPVSGENYCPRTWDGWNCWPDTPVGTNAQAPCPSYIYFNSDKPQCTRYAKKTCWDNGTWYINFRGNEYSDYSTCGQGEDIKLLMKTHLITFGISIVLLIPALIIFFYYRQLRVYRVFMHKNLFIALLLTAIFVTVFESYFILDSFNNPDSVLEANGSGCKLFFTRSQKQTGVFLFCVIGWGVPIIPVSIWAITRQLMADDLCWTVPGYYEWIIYVPMLTALIVNLCFLGHIVQIIITKLRSKNTNEPAQFRRAVKATMVLVPLVAFVSLLFCYLNSEVIYLLKRSYNRKKMVHDIASHMSSRRKRESRTSVSTNMETLPTEAALARKE
ncbi:calcitonin receptor [Caerostris extrusa]|uniref:Calcitonin receptor n=1 Tax=Caerostris extrusa TaxID=172846 RepID=A0AAV4TZY1_CAEEX|nr:calcitonin receptor [Caerostris extrusa]